MKLPLAFVNPPRYFRITWILLFKFVFHHPKLSPASGRADDLPRAALYIPGIPPPPIPPPPGMPSELLEASIAPVVE